MLPTWGLAAALGAGAAAFIAWNFLLGSRLSTMPGASGGFRALSGLCAFLFLPALVIGVLSSSAPGARVLAPLAWLWPAVAVGVVAQAAWALARRGANASAWVTIPILVFDLLVAWVLVVRWLEGLGAALAEWALAPGMALSMIAATALGNAAFVWAGGALVPALSPAAAARWRSTRVARVLVAAACAMAVAATAITTPRAYTALTSVPTLEAGAARGRDEPAIGLRLFGTLASAPSAAMARHDAALADSLGVTATHVELTAKGASASVLDSVARTLELRRDSMTLVITLDLDAGEPHVLMSSDALRARLAIVERVMRRLRPDVLVPAERVSVSTASSDVAWWQSYYEQAAATARRVDRTVTIALGTDASTAADSALADWVMQGTSPVDGIALAVRDGGARPMRFVAALASVARWVSLARVAPAVWIAGVPAAPMVTGEIMQQRLVRHALAYGTAHTWVRGVIVGDASDGSAATGLRTATGRSRRALAELGTMLRLQRDLPATAPEPPVPPDSLGAGVARAAPDTLSPAPR